MNFKEIIQRAGRKIRKDIYYIDENGNNIEIPRKEIDRVKYSFHSNLTGTIMKSLEVEIKQKINCSIYLKITASYEENSDYIEMGPFFLKDVEYNANSKTYIHNYYDYMIQTMVDYKAINVQYPCTLFQYFEQLITKLNLTTNIISLPNGERMLEKDIFTDINFTYRDVLDDIAKANGVLFYIDIDEVKIAELNKGNNAVITDRILKNTNVAFGEHYGPINSIVLSRSAESDNVYIQDEESINNNGLTEFKIVDNQLMNDNNRSDYLPALLAQLNGIEYDVFDTSLTGYGGFDMLQSVTFQTGNNTYESYVFNNEIELDNGYSETIFTELPSEVTTDYKASDKTDKRIDQAFAMVDKQNKEIKLYVKKGDLISEINVSSEAIELKGNRLIVEADNLEITQDGTLICDNATIRKGNLILEDNGTEEKASMKIKTTRKITKDLVISMDLSNSYLYQNFGDDFNFNEMPSITLFRTNNYQVNLRRIILGSIDYVRGYIHEIVVTNNKEYEEIIYKVTYDQNQDVYTTDINIQELKLPEDFGEITSIDYATYANYLKKLLINAGITSYSSEGIEADIYSNYKYTIDDYKKAYNYILGNIELTPEEFVFLDANGDGKINVQDIVLIERNGGIYNVSDTQPGKFIIKTHNTSENIQIIDKDGNQIVSMGITGAKVLSRNHPFLFDSNNLLSVGEALAYSKNEYVSQCGVWKDGKIINRIVYEIDFVDELNTILYLDKYLQNFSELVKIHGNVLTINGDWIPINVEVMGDKIEAKYNDLTGLAIKSNVNIQKGTIILEYTS